MKPIKLLLLAVVLAAATPVAARSIDCDKLPTPDLQARVMDFVISRLAPGDVLDIEGHCRINLTIPANVIDITLDGNNQAVLQGPDSSLDTLRIEGSGIVVRNLEITGGRDGVHIHWGGQAQQRGGYGLEGNHIHHTGRHGITIHGNSSSRFANNVIADNPGWGVNVFENSTARIGISNLGDSGDGNTIVRNGGGGIYVERTSTAHVVSNMIADNAGPGVEIARSSYGQVLGNSILRNGHRGISFGGGSSGRVAYNDISQNDLAGIRVRKNSNATIEGNSSTIPNTDFGVACSLASLVDGRLDGLSGTVANYDTDGTCTQVLADHP